MWPELWNPGISVSTGYHFRSFDGVAIYMVHIHIIPTPHYYPYISIFELILQVKGGIMKRPGLSFG